MSKRSLLLIIFVLLITNVFSLIYFNNKEDKDDAQQNEINDISGDLPDKTITSSDDYVASLRDEHITYKDWIQSLRETYGKEHLQKMILEKIVNKLAEERNLTVNEKVIEREIAFLTTMSGVMNDDQLAKQKETWQEELRFQFLLEQLLTEDIEIPESEARAYYETYKNHYDFSASFQISHIVVPNMSTAEKVINELEQGAVFSLLAQEYSIDEETKHLGGYLGYYTHGSQLIPYGYSNIISNMEELTYSDPVNMGDRVVIIYLHRDLPEIEFTYDEIKDYVIRELALKQVDQQEKIKELLERENIEWIYNDEI